MRKERTKNRTQTQIDFIICLAEKEQEFSDLQKSLLNNLAPQTRKQLKAYLTLYYRKE